ncbi:hypothetical protein BH23VER1_BH23VER1_16320 [soil metagenome]
MDYFISSGEGDQRGPFAAYTLKGMVEEGEVSPDDLVWFRGAEAWKPLREVESLEWIVPGERVDEDDDEEEEEDTGDEVADEARAAAGGEVVPPALPRAAVPHASVLAPAHPWRRFCARAFDVYLFMLVTYGIAIKAALVDPMDLFMPKSMLMMLLPALGWALVEASLLSVVGTTPGKVLFRIRIVDASGAVGKLPVGPALKRSFMVAFFGCGLGMPIITVIALAVSYLRLKTRGGAIWDESAGTKLIFGGLSPGRILLIVGFFFVLMAALGQLLPLDAEAGVREWIEMFENEAARRAGEGAANGVLQ